MADLKNSGSQGDTKIHLSFNLVGDNTFNTQKKYIERLLYSTFGPVCTLEHENPIATGDSIAIYSIAIPANCPNEELKMFFEKLNNLFDKTSRFLPSFTQGLEIK